MRSPPPDRGCLARGGARAPPWANASPTFDRRKGGGDERAAREPRVIFVAWLEAIRRGELDESAARLAREVTWQGVEPQFRCGDRDQVLDMLRARVEEGTPRVERLQLEAAGDRVLLGIAGPDFHSIGDVPLGGEVFIVVTLREDGGS